MCRITCQKHIYSTSKPDVEQNTIIDIKNSAAAFQVILSVEVTWPRDALDITTQRMMMMMSTSSDYQ